MASIVKEETGLAAKEVQAKDLNVIRSPHYRLIYTNLAETGLSTMDLRITFSVIHETEPRKLGIEQEVTLVMAPPFAHAVAQMLARNIEMWQERYNQSESDENKAKAEAEAMPAPAVEE